MADDYRRLFDSIAAHEVTNGSARAFVRGLTNTAFRWHPLGFIHARIWSNGEKVLRVHIWPRDERRVQEPAWMIHDHMFDFNSYVVCGRLENRLYNVAHNAAGSSVLYDVSYDSAGSVMSKTDTGVTTALVSSQGFGEGDHYSEVGSEYHASFVPLEVCTITLLAARLTSDRNPHVVGDRSGLSRYTYARTECDPADLRRIFETCNVC